MPHSAPAGPDRERMTCRLEHNPIDWIRSDHTSPRQFNRDKRGRAAYAAGLESIKIGLRGD